MIFLFQIITMRQVHYLCLLLLLLPACRSSEGLWETLEDLQNEVGSLHEQIVNAPSDLNQSIQDFFYSLGPLSLTTRIASDVYEYTDIPGTMLRQYFLHESPKVYRRKRETSYQGNTMMRSGQLKSFEEALKYVSRENKASAKKYRY